MSYILAAKNSMQSLTNVSIFKNSADINIETTFLRSSLGP
jgi:hypothetical protein